MHPWPLNLNITNVNYKNTVLYVIDIIIHPTHNNNVTIQIDILQPYVSIYFPINGNIIEDVIVARN
jgi:hypothetical protein